MFENLPTHTRSADEKLKVVCIAGEGRSGSTIIGDILGQIDGFTSVGELFYFWDRGLIQNWQCSCGRSFAECPVWSEVVAQAFGSRSEVNAEKLLGMRNHLHTRHLLAIRGRRGLRERIASMEEYRQALGRLYRGVQAATGSRVIVDGSGYPAQAYLLQSITDIDLYVLHLVRDARAVVYSFTSRKKKVEADLEGKHDHYMGSDSLLASSLAWDMYSSVIESTWGDDPQRYALLRYEDFAQNPKAVMEWCLRFIDEDGAKLPFVNDREVSLDVTHTFSGNPGRFRRGTTVIRLDDEWQYKMSRSQRALVTTVALPWLRRFGYPLAVRD